MTANRVHATDAYAGSPTVYAKRVTAQHVATRAVSFVWLLRKIAISDNPTVTAKSIAAFWWLFAMMMMVTAAAIMTRSAAGCHDSAAASMASSCKKRILAMAACFRTLNRRYKWRLHAAAANYRTLLQPAPAR